MCLKKRSEIQTNRFRYVAGYGLGPMLWAPMSEIPYFGRNPIYIGTLCKYLLFTTSSSSSLSNFRLFSAIRFQEHYKCCYVLSVSTGSRIHHSMLMSNAQCSYSAIETDSILGFYGHSKAASQYCSREEQYPYIHFTQYHNGHKLTYPVVFVLFQIPTALATNFGMLLAFRFLTGFFGSPALATGGATIADIYRPQKQAYGLSIWGIGAVCGPCLGPLVGGFAVQVYGWTWTIWELMWVSGFCWVFLFFFLPETGSTNILYTRTKRLRKMTGNSKLTCEPEIMAESMTPKDVGLH
jgi:multidrug resistance protein